MGHCLSCCEEQRLAQYNGQAKNAPVSRPLNKPANKQSYYEDHKHAPPPSYTESSDSLQSERTQKGMFNPYPKLPPIRTKSAQNGDSKRQSMSSGFSEAKIVALFERYKDPEEDCILADGIETFCADLDVRPEEFRVLLLAWNFQAATMCKFTREEFTNGCRTLKVDSIKGIQGKFPEMLTEIQDKQSFKDLYRWTYKFGLDVDTGQRTLPVEIAISLWSLVFSIHTPPILKRWLDFLDKHPSIRGVPKDTWDMFLNFSDSIGSDLSSYDDTEAWPSLFDDFVEYENDRVNQNVLDDDPME
ncbi:unnamed protein product [Owenia fusiformis]|uniref:Defective in cullin neddylation protein n=1 Tax=Owenia fusiformis TaxID=6347 RepID=A0A8J1UNL4_OWEFU|nr:unnamed protein product [Owenia fusiformis]